MVSILLLPSTVMHAAQKLDYQEEWKPIVGQLCPVKSDKLNNLQWLSEHVLFVISHTVSLSCFLDLTCTAEFCQQSYFSCECENNCTPLLIELCCRRELLLAWLMLQGKKTITKLTEIPSSTNAHGIFTGLLCQNSCAQTGGSTEAL